MLLNRKASNDAEKLPKWHAGCVHHYWQESDASHAAHTIERFEPSLNKSKGLSISLSNKTYLFVFQDDIQSFFRYHGRVLFIARVGVVVKIIHYI